MAAEDRASAWEAADTALVLCLVVCGGHAPVAGQG